MEPSEIVSRGAARGVPVEGFQPIWDCAAMRIARAAWAGSGIEVFLRMEVPYGATSSGRLSEDAVQLLLETGPKPHPCRFLEIGAGSGIFAKIFLDILKAEAPGLYQNCTYVLTDGNAQMLESLASHGVLAAHAGRVETMVLDASAPSWPEALGGGFDAVFGSYILDSLPVEVLSVGESGVQQMLARCALPSPNPALEAALKTPGHGHLAPFLPMAKTLRLQTRHQPAGALPWAKALPPEEGEDRPMVHCHGALACMARIRDALRPGGFAMLTDYGTLTPREPSEQVEFQNFGASAAMAVNFHQLDSWFGADSSSKVAYLKPEAEEGQLITRVFYNGPADDLRSLVDLLFGEARQTALRLPVEAAREMLRANAFETARQLYAKAMALQPRNWSLAEEVAELLLLAAGDYDDAIALAEFGLGLNPVGPNLYRIIAQARLHKGDTEGARTALQTALRLAGPAANSLHLKAQILDKSEDYTGALQAIGHALSLDKEAELRESLLRLQDEILAKISLAAREELLNEVNRSRALDGFALP